MTGTPPPNNTALITAATNLGTALNAFATQLGSVNPINPTGPAGGGAGGNNRNNNADDFQKFLVKVAGPLALGIGIFQMGKEIDKLQRRALASDTSIELLDKSYRGLHGSNLKLMGEILNFRNEGIKKMTAGTLQLVSRMKMTDQSTHGLISLMGENSVALMMSVTEQGNLADSIMKSSLTFGATQENVIKTLNGVAKSLELAKVSGYDTAGTLKGVADLASQYGPKLDSVLKSGMNFFAGPDFQSKILLGVQNANLGSAKGIKEAFRTAAATLESRMSKTGNQALDISINKQIFDMFGGMENAMAILQANSVMQSEMPEVINGFQSSVKSFQGIIDDIKKPLEVVVVGLYNFVNSFSAGVKKIVGWISAGVGVFLALRSILTPLLTLFGVGSGPIGWISLAVGGLVSLAGGMASSNKEMNDNLEDINAKTPEPEVKKPTNSNSMYDFLNSTLYSVLTNQKVNDSQIKQLEQMNATLGRINMTLERDYNMPERIKSSR